MLRVVILKTCPDGGQNPSEIIENSYVKSLKMTPWSPKSIQNHARSMTNHSRDPFGAQGAPRAARGPPLQQLLTASFTFLTEPGRSKGPFLAPGGFQKGSEIVQTRSDGDLGGAKRRKGPLREGVWKMNQKTLKK